MTIAGQLPQKRAAAPSIKLAAADPSEKGLGDFAGKKKVLNIVQSLDTSVCATSARKFNEAVNGMGDVVLLNISADLPFAAGRVCSSVGLKNVVSLSTFPEGPAAGLMSRAVVILDSEDRVVWTQQVAELTDEPDYDGALAALKGL